jgi:hypothetical protein
MGSAGHHEGGHGGDLHPGPVERGVAPGLEVRCPADLPHRRADGADEHVWAQERGRVVVTFTSLAVVFQPAAD